MNELFWILKHKIKYEIYIYEIEIEIKLRNTYNIVEIYK